MKKTFLHLIIPLMVLTPLVVVSCEKNNFNQEKRTFIDHVNYANDYNYLATYQANSASDNIQKINLMSESKLLRIKTKQQPQIDFRDSIVIKPTELNYQFEYAKSIKISSNNEIKTFSNDLTDEVSYESEDQPKPNIFYPKKDKGNGFNLPYLFIPSSDKNSINHPDFFKALANSKGFSITVDSNQGFWIDYKGNFENKTFLSANDFKLNILKTALLDKNFRNQWLTDHNLELSEDEKSLISENENLFSNDFISYLNSYHIDLNRLLDFESDSLNFFTINNEQRDLSDFFKNIFLYTNFVDGLPYEYIVKKYGNIKQQISWLFDYASNYKNRLYSSYYFISSNANNEINLIRNKNYRPDKNDLEKITIKYNSIPISTSTFGTQMYNAFSQNIVSSLNFNALDVNQKQEILTKYAEYNIGYSRQVKKYQPHNKIINNLLPIAKDHYFNSTFSELYYGVKLNELTEDLNVRKINSSESYIFRTLINNLINQYGFSEKNDDIWLSQAPEDINILASSQGLNYNFLRDALVNISKPYIATEKQGNQINTIANNYQFKNKDYANAVDNHNISKKLKPHNFEIIKKYLNQIIEDYYQKNPNAKNIEFDIPIKAFAINASIRNIVAKINSIFNQINQHLKPKIVLIENFDQYEEYFLKNKSIYKENDFKLLKANTQEFIITEILSLNSNIFMFINNLDNYQFTDANIFKEMKKYLEFLKTHKLNFDHGSIKEFNDWFKAHKQQIQRETTTYLEKLKLEDNINFINEINNTISYVLSFENQIANETFDKIIYQKFIQKPIAFDGLDYFQDILIESNN
ncbi:hypothetical protein HGG64_02820 [Mycoplasma phocoeninasale]|uniref:Lipoprotein n=1 Tax=Mycoplasma phocoeninasale TaxID=2726117 RepID=A0A858U5S3_9MOLU|nr:hypothetical protein [Mycoplasma phocoeninasale]QJG66615.1 hypothetical protein HGG64_02820 [Mycoplasma phocoeninasale]